MDDLATTPIRPLAREEPLAEAPPPREPPDGGLADSFEAPPPDRSGTLTVIVIAGVILLGGGGVMWWWFSSRSAPPPSPPAPVETPQEPADPAPAEPGAPPAEAAPPAEGPPPPDLYQSDSLVRDIVAGLSRHAEWAAWLVSEELALNFVRAVAAVAYDEPPQTSLEPMRPEEGFSVIRRGQRFYPAETSYRRYDLPVAVFESIDADGAANAYRLLEPLFEQAHDELGYPNEFGDTLEQAVVRLLETPILNEPPELRLRVISFEHVDPELEALSPAQKLLLRLGPANGERVRAKVRELYAATQ